MWRRLDITENEGNAIEEAVAWHTVGIVAAAGESIGTGSAILWRQRSLILTARHVLETSPNGGIWFHFRHEGTMKRSPIEELWSRPDMLYTRKVAIEIRGRYCSKDADLAALEVPRGIGEQYQVKFFELAEDLATPPPGTIVTMRGSSSDLAKAVAPGVLASFEVVQWARIQEKPLFEPFDPVSEFLLKFVAADKGIGARGFSGAGAWFFKATEGVWHPNLGLAGVCTAYYPRRKLLSVLRIEQVTRFLDGALPA